MLTGVTPGMAAHHQELFGPVAVVYSVHDDDEALALANDTPYGLGGAVFSTDPERARRLAEQLECGMANVNAAEAEAFRVRRGEFSREAQQRIARAQSLLRVAGDATATPPERSQAYELAGKELDGLIVLPEPTRLSLERGIAGELD